MIKLRQTDLLWSVTNLPVHGKSYSPSNSRSHDNFGRLQDRLGSILRPNKNGGKWSQTEAQDHINILELKAAFIALKSFVKHQMNKVICLKMDTTAVAYLNNLGGTHCHRIDNNTRRITFVGTFDVFVRKN